MARVFLTGGSGFIAAHVLKKLLARGHSVVTTVRSNEKARKIFALYPNEPKSKLDVVVVEDVGNPGAFDKAIISKPPFDVVIHTASPYRFDITDVKTEVLDPAIIGTVGILESIMKYAPSVKRVIITSSMLAILDTAKGPRPGYTYTEDDWNPMSMEEALSNPLSAYLGSKTFAERAAWRFMETKKPSFTLSCINPSVVLGPVIDGNPESLNPSEWAIRDLLSGQCKTTDIPNNNYFYWVDVRDVAESHIKAIDTPGGADDRLMLITSVYTNRGILEVIRAHFPEYHDQLPPQSAAGGDLPKEGLFEVDNTKRRKVFGDGMIDFETSVIDTVKCFKKLGL